MNLELQTIINIPSLHYVQYNFHPNSPSKSTIQSFRRWMLLIKMPNRVLSLIQTSWKRPLKSQLLLPRGSCNFERQQRCLSNLHIACQRWCKFGLMMRGNGFLHGIQIVAYLPPAIESGLFRTYNASQIQTIPPMRNQNTASFPSIVMIGW